MARLTRVTEPTLDVVRLLLGSADPVWGLAIAKSVARPPGTVYPILARLEELGWIAGAWESESEHTGPRRRLYRLTDDGRVEGAAVVAERAARTAVAPAPRLAFGAAG